MLQNLLWATGYNTVCNPARGRGGSLLRYRADTCGRGGFDGLSTIIVAINARLLRLN